MSIGISLTKALKKKRRVPRQREAAAPLEPRLKMCVLAACPFPANHGTPGSIRELAEATAERGHEVHVVTYHFGEDLPLRNVHLHRIPAWTSEQTVRVGPTPYRPLYDFQMIFKAIQVMRRHNVDLIHAHGYEAALAAAFCRPVVRRPVLYSAHNQMGDELGSYNFFRWKWMARSLAWLLDHTVPRIGNRCIPHSDNLRRFLVARGLAGRSEPVLNFGIDVDRQPVGNREQLRRQYGLSDEPVVLYSGVMDRFQRLDLLLEGMAHVLRRVPRAKLMLVVNVPHAEQEQAIRDEAQRLGIAESILFAFPSDMNEGLRLLSVCDVAVVPRPCAPGFPIKLLNYLSARRPCAMFASSASGVAHGEHVWMAEEDTGESLGNAITHLLKDAPLRARLAAEGHRFVRERHDRRLVAGQLCRAYVRLMQETRHWEEIAARPQAAPRTNEIDFTETLPLDGTGFMGVGIHASA